MAIVHARANVHVQARQRQALLADGLQRQRQIGVPDAVFAVLAARVGLVAVAVAKAGLMRSHTAWPFGSGAQLAQHVDGTGVHRHTVLHHAVERGSVEQVGGEHDLRRFATALKPAASARRISPRDTASTFTPCSRISLEDVDVGAGLLRKAHRVEVGHLRNALANGGRVIHPQRVPNWSARATTGRGEGVGHGENSENAEI